MAHAAALDIEPEQTCAPLDQIVTDSRAWTRDEIDPENCIVLLDARARDEVAQLAKKIADNPLPVLLRHPDQFDMPALRAAMDKAKSLLDTGTGIAVIDRLPMDELTEDTAVAVFWLLGHLIARPVAQKWDGTMLYDVTDTGAKYSYGVRGSYTSV
ncbi:MAG: hypothetical protein ACR2OM_08335, partial [Aestuariivirgaceae bacterium]